MACVRRIGKELCKIVFHSINQCDLDTLAALIPSQRTVKNSQKIASYARISSFSSYFDLKQSIPEVIKAHK